MEDILGGLLGQYHTTMDDKGRFALPAKLRSFIGPNKKPLLDGELIVTKGLEGCLSLYPQSEWAVIQQRLSSLNFTKRDFRFFSRRFYSSAQLVSPDKNGRISSQAVLLRFQNSHYLLNKNYAAFITSLAVSWVNTP